MDAIRLQQQIAFVREADNLKRIRRQILITDGSRRENGAEHSRHLGLMALVLDKVARHPGIDGYDEAAHLDQADRESAAADRMFNRLTEDQAAAFRALWDEFEAGRTPEAKFAAALDRLPPLLHNLFIHGRMGNRHGVVKSQVIGRNHVIADSAPDRWAYYARDLIDRAVDRGPLDA